MKFVRELSDPAIVCLQIGHHIEFRRKFQKVILYYLNEYA